MSVDLKCHHGSPARIGQLSSDKCSIGWKLFCKTCYDYPRRAHRSCLKHRWALAVEMGAVWDINLVDLVMFS